MIGAGHIASHCEFRVFRPQGVPDNHVVHYAVPVVLHLNGVSNGGAYLNGFLTGGLIHNERGLTGGGCDFMLGIRRSIAIDICCGRIVDRAVGYILRRYGVGVGDALALTNVKARNRIAAAGDVDGCSIQLSRIHLAGSPHVIGNGHVQLGVARVLHRDRIGKCITLHSSVVRTGHAGDGLIDADVGVVDGNFGRLIRCFRRCAIRDGDGVLECSSGVGSHNRVSRRNLDVCFGSQLTNGEVVCAINACHTLRKGSPSNRSAVVHRVRDGQSIQGGVAGVAYGDGVGNGVAHIGGSIVNRLGDGPVGVLYGDARRIVRLIFRPVRCCSLCRVGEGLTGVTGCHRIGGGDGYCFIDRQCFDSSRCVFERNSCIRRRKRELTTAVDGVGD